MKATILIECERSDAYFFGMPYPQEEMNLKSKIFRARIQMSLRSTPTELRFLFVKT